MNILNHTSHSRSRRRPVLAALLLAAFAVAVLAGSALAANLVTNGSFEKDTNGDGVPNGWVLYSLSPADKRVCNQSVAGSCSFRTVGDGGGKALAQQLAGGLAGDEFNLSVWTKGKTIVYGAGYAAVYVLFNFTGGGGETWYIDIPAGTSPWTLRQLSVNAPANYDSIEIGLQSSIASGKAWLDKLKLVPTP